MKKRKLLSKWRTVAVLKANLVLARRKKSFVLKALHFANFQLLKKATIAFRKYFSICQQDARYMEDVSLVA
jgi:hypothetical protein